MARDHSDQDGTGSTRGNYIYIAISHIAVDHLTTSSANLDQHLECPGSGHVQNICIAFRVLCQELLTCHVAICDPLFPDSKRTSASLSMPPPALLPVFCLCLQCDINVNNCLVCSRLGSLACMPVKKDLPQEDETAASDSGTWTSNPSPRLT